MVRSIDASKTEFFELRQGPLTLAGNTNDVIQWTRLPERLAESPPPLADDERIRLLVKLLNGRALTYSQWNQIVGLNVVSSAKAGIHAAKVDPEARVLLRRALAACLHPVSGRKATEMTEEDLSGRILLHPEGDRVRVIAPAYFVAVMFAITRAARAGNVRECGNCGDFFFLRKGPGAPPKFCSVECSTEADTKKAAARMRKIRRGRP